MFVILIKSVTIITGKKLDLVKASPVYQVTTADLADSSSPGMWSSSLERYWQLCLTAHSTGLVSLVWWLEWLWRYIFMVGAPGSPGHPRCDSCGPE